MSLDRLLVALSAIFVMFAGIACLVAPASFAEQAGLAATSSGLTEIRAFYGGLEIGLGCFLFWCMRQRTRTMAGLLLVGLTVGATGMARILGMLIDHAPTTFHLTNLAVEITTVGLIGLAIWRQPASLGSTAAKGGR